MILPRAKVETVPIFNNIIKKISPLNCIALAASNGLKNENLFSSLCSSETSDFLIEVLKRMPTSKDNFDFRWPILCSIGMISPISENGKNDGQPAKYIISKVPNDFSSEMALNDFTKIKDPLTKLILPYMSKSHNKIDDKTAHNISFYLILLRDEKPGIFYNILPLLKGLLTNVKYERIFKAIGLEVLSLFTEAPIEFFSSLNGEYCEEKDMTTLFAYPINFQAPEFTKFLQTTLMMEKYLFPVPFYGNMNNSTFCSLLNSSIEKVQHILDLINEVVMEHIINADIEGMKKSTCLFPELIPYFLIVNQSLLYSDLDSFAELVETQYPPSPATTLVERFKNDFHLIQLMSMLSGTDICSGDLLINSIPYHLIRVLDQKVDDILVASKAEYFSISDKDARTDFDFIRSFAAFQYFMKALENQQAKQNLIDLLQKMVDYIDLIQNPAAKINIIFDIFSLIFMTYKDGSFVCSPYFAYKLTEKLSVLNNSDYVSCALKLFQKQKPKKSDQSLLPWLDKDTSAIYNAIENLDWETAEELSLYSPSCKKIYTRSHDAYLYLNEGVEPTKSPDLIKLNVGLSNFDHRSVLKSLLPKFSKYEKILEERIRSQDIINPFPTADKWNPISEIFQIFNKSSTEFVKKIPDFLSTFQLSKNLHDFLHFIWLYYTCARCGDYFHANTINDLFVFDIYKAFAGPIEVGEFDTAEKLSKELKIDLIPFIFENISHFNSFDEVVIEKMSQFCQPAAKALLISLAKSSDPEGENDYREKYLKIISKDKKLEKTFEYLTKEIKTEEVDQTQLIDQILLSVNDPQAIDDLIYQVDHEKLYEHFMTKPSYNEEKLSTTFYPIFYIVSYVAPEADLEKVERIRIRHKVRKYSQSTVPAEVVRDLMLREKFQLSLRYLKKCVPPAETASPLFQLFSGCLALSSNLINQKEIDISPKKSSKRRGYYTMASSPSFASLTSLTFVDDILAAFPDKFDLILSRFFHIPGIIKTLCKYSPDDKKSYMNGLMHLPELIFSDSYILSIDAIIDSYIRNYRYIFDINQEIANLFNDENLLSLAKGVLVNLSSKSESFDYLYIFNGICVHLYPFFENKSILVKLWISFVEDNFEKFGEIKSNQNEWNLNFFIQRLKTPLHLFLSDEIETKILNQLKSLILFISFFPYSKLKKTYHINLYEFDSENIQLMKLIDNDKLVKEICESFQIDLEDYLLEKSKLKFEFCQYELGWKSLSDNSLNIANYDKRIRLYDSSYSFLTPLNKLHFLQQSELLKVINIDSINYDLNVYKSLREKVTEMTKLHVRNVKLVDEKVLRLMYRVIKTFCTRSSAIMLLISFNQFDSAYDLLMKENVESQSDLFIHSFFISVQLNSSNKLFKKFLLEKDPNLDKTNEVLISAINFFKKKEMSYSLDYVYGIRNQLEDSALIEVELFKDCISYEKQVYLIGQIIYNLETSLKYRKNPSNHSPPIIINREVPANDLENLLEKAIIQLNISSMWIEKGIPFSKEYDMITSIDGAITVSAILYLNNNKDLLNQIIALTKITMKDITSKVCEVLSNQPVNKIIEFWNNLKKHKATLGQNVPFELLNALAMSSNRQILQTIIISFFSSNEDRCELLLEYDYIAEAYMIAQDASLKDFIPLIGKRAALLGNMIIYDNCVKLLSKKK